MINVECPSCSAPYELDERRLPKKGLRMRCPKCNASFRVHQDGSTEEAAAKPSPKSTMVGMGVAPPAAPKAPIAPPVPAERKAPIAPPVPAPASDAADLPARKPTASADLPARKPTASADLPARKPTASGDLPARKPTASGDLPARKPTASGDLPARKPASPGGLDLDLPAPAAASGGMDLDLPAPAAASGGMDLDLPAPAAASGGLDLDLPAPAAAVGGMDLDLPAPGGPGGGLDLDLPAPGGPGGGLDLDLPAPGGPGGGLDLDLPAPAAAGGFDLDLPAPGGGGGLDLDLPAPGGDLGGLGLDLPAPGGAGLPAPAGVGLPAPAGVGLPAPGAQLPAPGGVGLPAPGGQLPAPGGQLPVPGGQLPAPGGQLPAPGGHLPSPMGGGDDDDFDLSLPEPKQRGGAGPKLSGEFDLPGLDDEDDDLLSLPEPSGRAGGGMTADGRAGAGGASFGEIDLGGGPGAGGDSLEYTGIDEDDADEDDEGFDMDLPDAPVAGAAEKRRKKKAKLKKEDEERRQKRIRRGRQAFLAFVAVLGLVSGVGYALSFTSAGLFGIYFIEQFRPEAGDPAATDRFLAEVEAISASDTYPDLRTTLRRLADKRRQEYLNRELLARSAMHEALFQIRIGEDARTADREETILRRLEARGNEAPGIATAIAASQLRRGNVGVVSQYIAQARAESPNDAYVYLIEGEMHLTAGNLEASAQAFQTAVENGAGARGHWGLARALAATQDPDGYEAAIDGVLELSPFHGSANLAKSQFLLSRRDVDGAIQRAIWIARGFPAEDGTPQSEASPRERALALTFAGSAEEARGRRGLARQYYQGAVQADAYLVDALLGLGRVLLQERRFNDAITNFQAVATAVGPNEGPPGGRPYVVSAKLGEIEGLLQTEQTPTALSAAQALATQHPQDAEVLLAYGRALQAGESYEAALQTFQQAVTLDPANFEGYLAQANLQFEQEEPDQAIATLQAARENVEMTPDVRVSLGDAEMRRRNYRAAEAEYRAALALRDDFVAAFYGLGRALRRQNRLDAAERYFNRLSEVDPTFPGLALERGRIFEARGQAARAVTYYRRALEQRPDDLDLKLSLAGALVVAQQGEEAEPLLAEIRSAREDSATAEYYTGRMYFQREEYDAALRHLEMACRLDPRAGEHLLYRGWVHLRMNSLARANESVQAALRLDPQLADAYFVRGQIRMRTGNATDALTDFQRAIELNPNRNENLAALAEALDQLSQRDAAVQVYTQAVARDPEQGEWWYRLGALRFDQGNREGALEALTHATAIGDEASPSPGWLAEAHRLSGEANRLGGQNDAAISHYQRFLELAPATNFDRGEVGRHLRELGAPAP